MKKGLVGLLAFCMTGALFAVEVAVSGKPSHKISEYIYGINGAAESMKRRGLVTVDRPGGGNPSTTHNWEINCNNGAGDWFYLNRETGDHPPPVVDT